MSRDEDIRLTLQYTNTALEDWPEIQRYANIHGCASHSIMKNLHFVLTLLANRDSKIFYALNDMELQSGREHAAWLHQQLSDLLTHSKENFALSLQRLQDDSDGRYAALKQYANRISAAHIANMYGAYDFSGLLSEINGRLDQATDRVRAATQEQLDRAHAVVDGKLKEIDEYFTKRQNELANWSSLDTVKSAVDKFNHSIDSNKKSIRAWGIISALLGGLFIVFTYYFTHQEFKEPVSGAIVLFHATIRV